MFAFHLVFWKPSRDGSASMKKMCSNKHSNLIGGLTQWFNAWEQRKICTLVSQIVVSTHKFLLCEEHNSSWCFGDSSNGFLHGLIYYLFFAICYVPIHWTPQNPKLIKYGDVIAILHCLQRVSDFLAIKRATVNGIKRSSYNNIVISISKCTQCTWISTIKKNTINNSK